MRSNRDEVWCILGATGAAPGGAERGSCGGVGMRCRVKRRFSAGVESATAGEAGREKSGNCSLVSPSDNGGVKGDALATLACLDKLLEEADGRSAVVVAVWLMVDRLARAVEVLWAKAAKERRLRREIEPTTDPVKEGG